MQTLLEHNKLQRVSNAAAAAQTAVNSTAVDTTGYDSVTFVALFGAIDATAVTSVKLQGGALANGSDAVDLLGTSVSVAADDDNQIVALELNQPTYRYIRAVISRATADSVVDGIVALLGNPKTMPVTHDATTVVDTEVHVAPGAGTA